MLKMYDVKLIYKKPLVNFIHFCKRKQTQQNTYKMEKWKDNICVRKRMHGERVEEQSGGG